MIKKLSFSFLLILLIFFSMSLKIKALTTTIYNVVTNPAEDMASQINVNWHSDVEGTRITYTKADDLNWSNTQIVNGECTPFQLASSFTDIGKVINTTGFTFRYKCQASITNLDANTKYMYRIGKNDLVSTSNYYFQTAGTIDDEFSFLFLTDPQYANAAGAEVFNDLVNKALTIDNDIRFSLFSGDVVDRGGIMEQWNILFNQSSLKKMPIAVVPGNHEYLDSANTTYNSTFYNGFYNNPDNGAEGVKNSSFYFKYNNVLFIGIDSEAAWPTTSINMTRQQEWFERVCKENQAQYIVVTMHRSSYGSIYADISPMIRAKWQPLFDKYGVDIVLTGHDHVYSRTFNIFNDEISNTPYQGTTYLIGGSSGLKYYDLTTDPMYEKSFQKISTVTIFKVDDQGLNLKTINISGEVLDEKVIAAKRSKQISQTTFNKQDFLDNITLETDQLDRSKALLDWDESAYGNVLSIKLTDEANNVYGLDYIHSDKISLPLSNLEENEFINYTLKVDFLDGTSLEKPLLLSTKAPYGTISNFRFDETLETNINLRWDSDLLPEQVRKFDVYLNGLLFGAISPMTTQIDLLDLNKYKLNTIRFEAIDFYGDVVFMKELTYGEDADPVTIAFENQRLDLQVGNEATTSLIITPNQELDLNYTSSNEAVATVDANGKVTAVGAGRAVITVKVAFRPDVSAKIDVYVEAVEDVEEEPAKKGCFAKDYSIVSFSTLGLFTILLILRRRKY